MECCGEGIVTSDAAKGKCGIERKFILNKNFQNSFSGKIYFKKIYIEVPQRMKFIFIIIIFNL